MDTELDKNHFQVPTWMKEFDEDNDGRLNYKEFKQVVFKL